MPYCERCNRIIVWGKTFDGVRVALDPKAAVYRVFKSNGDENEIDRSASSMVAQSATCPRPYYKQVNSFLKDNDE